MILKFRIFKYDPGLSFRMSCGHGVCGSDGMRINGISSLACQKLARDFKENEDGAWGCQTKWMCTKVCPKEIPVTKEIFEVKKRILKSKKDNK